MVAPKKLAGQKSPGTKQMSITSKSGSKLPPFEALMRGTGKKDYAKKPKSATTDMGLVNFGVPGPMEEN